ncbi:hypothetical protein HMPREF9163_01098 [Selenomonas sp. oral taxon 138 str. F0429]|nr:hypothetical protein HMPREF9163_01098 [Selenomonas sp. oral taxon 138 str. F0429]
MINNSYYLPAFIYSVVYFSKRKWHEVHRENAKSLDIHIGFNYTVIRIHFNQNS